MAKSKYYSTKQIREIINSYQIYEPHIHKEIATKVIPIVLASVGGILVKIINQEK